MSLINYKNETYPSGLNEVQMEQLYSKVDIIYLVLDSGGVIVSCNSTFLEAFDTEKELILGKNFLDWVRTDLRENLHSEIAKCAQRGYIREIQTVLCPKLGKPVHVRLNGLSNSEPDGKTARIRLFIQDITALMSAEQRKSLMSRLVQTALQHVRHERLLKEILADIQKTQDCDGIGLSIRKSTGEKQCLGNWKAFEGSDSEKDFRRWTPDKWKTLADRLETGVPSDTLREKRILLSDIGESSTLPSNPDTVQLLTAFGNYRSLAAVPVQEDTVSGYLIFADRQAGAFDSGDLAFFVELASMLPGFFRQSPAASDPLPGPAAPEVNLPSIPFAGVCVTRNGVIEQSNPWIQRFLGADDDMLRGKLMVEFVDPEYQHAWTDFQGQEDAEPVKLKVWTLEGKARFVLCAAEKAFSDAADEQVWYWVEIPETADPKQQILHRKKMETLGLLAGGIVLDFNNQLACILGYSSLLSEKIPPESPHFQDLQQIIATTEKSVELTSRLLACSQGSPYVVDDLDVNPLISEVAGIMSKTFSKDLLIRAELDPGLNRIHGDASRIQQSILEIALNAKEAMPGGGKIVFQTRNTSLGEKDLRSRDLKPGDFIQITISDTGCGMTGELKKQLFDSASDLTGEGGVGLGMVRQTVEDQNGFISVFSEKGQGTVFKITLPAQKKTSSRRVEAKTGELSGGRETILLVDDETALRETGQKMLRRYGYQVIPAENGNQALELYKKHGSQIDLILLDMMLPGVEINKILEWFYKVNPKTKILASVGAGERDSVEKSLRFDVTGFVQKPFHIRPLLHSIRAILNA
jgi:PAS domain S-box-containing protein